MGEPGDKLNIKRETPLTLPSPKSEEQMALRRAEWQRLRKRVGRLTDPLAGASSWAATFLGLALGGAVSLASVVGATEHRKSWVVPTLGVSSIACFVIAVFAFWVHTKMRASRKDDVE